MEPFKPAWMKQAIADKEAYLARQRQGGPAVPNTAQTSPAPSNSTQSPWQMLAGQPQGQAVEKQVKPEPQMKPNDNPVLNQEAANAFVKGFRQVR